MHPHVVEACAALYRRIARTQGFNHWLTDQAEEALTELVNNAQRSAPPPHLVRNALSNASKKLKRRSVLEDEFLHSLSFGSDRPINHSIAESGLDIEAVLSRMPTAERTLLELSADGADAGEIALEIGLPVQRVRERLSRARARARALRMGTPL
ncbi:sigma factor-like helix-turn-helix DNA-binding protein [Burkholderia sp. BCC1644]|uniref:sigma factor-like helix-turn-helix DNA-binding protein n=1 Tax=Burkholderia sp. BCC1644 TaxID=2676293 RepID=UPI00158FE4E8|nr:sigma factor-like helix-turn-helix DNA-binding protein [Burkholderia sp. BCC1644]